MQARCVIACCPVFGDCDAQDMTGKRGLINRRAHRLLLSYGASWTLLDEVLPIGSACCSVRNAMQRIGQRIDREVNPELTQVAAEGSGVCHSYVANQTTFAAGRLDRFLAREGIGESAALAVITNDGEDVLGAGYFHYRSSQQLLALWIPKCLHEK